LITENGNRFLPNPISYYKVLCIKFKISYEAFYQEKTIVELFYSAIEKSIEDLYGSLGEVDDNVK
jgi:hypothetical protein